MSQPIPGQAHTQSPKDAQILKDPRYGWFWSCRPCGGQGVLSFATRAQAIDGFMKHRAVSHPAVEGAAERP